MFGDMPASRTARASKVFGCWQRDRTFFSRTFATGPSHFAPLLRRVVFVPRGGISGTLAIRIGATSETIIMIRNGLYLVISKLLDGVEGGATGVSVLRDGTMRGGGAIYYHVGSYVCSGGKWKGELTVREHTPAEITRVFARQVVSMGFNGTYADDDAEFDATALVGKRSVQLKVMFRLLTPD